MGRRFLAEGPYRDEVTDNPEQATGFFVQLLKNPGGRILVSEYQGKLIGVFAFLVFPHFFSGEMTAGELLWYVEPEARKGGAGLKLLAAAEAMARDLGAKRMQMVAPTAEIEQLYKRRGYHQVEVGYQRRLA
jgi:GNAT superfamily N-acetyltransferase